MVTTTSSTTSFTREVITSFPKNPLPDAFSAPADCSAVYLSIVYMVAPSTTCLPPKAGTKSSQFFSPGTACPTGYWDACHDTAGVSTITTVTCCPIVNDLTLSCAPKSELKNVWSTLFCTWVASEPTRIAVTLSQFNSQTSTSSVPFTSPQGLNAFGIRMVYESTDIISTTSSSSMSITSSPTILSTSKSSPSNTSAATSSGATGLSTGARAAIGIAIPLALIAILGALAFWWRKKQRAKRMDYRVDQVTPAAAFQLQDQDKNPHGPLSELSDDGQRRSELAGGSYMSVRHDEPMELPAGNMR